MHVQDEAGCLGSSFDITNDGNSEINILDAVGYNLNQAPVPAPLIGFGFPVFLAVGGLLFGARLLDRARRGTGLFDVA
jgi:hypothetical protein